MEFNKLKNNININSIISKNQDMDDADLDGEKVMMNLDKGQYYMMNEVGSRIWELISEDTSVVSIITALLNEYDIDEETCENRVIEFLQKLNSENIISIK